MPISKPKPPDLALTDACFWRPAGEHLSAGGITLVVTGLTDTGDRRRIDLGLDDHTLADLYANVVLAVDLRRKRLIELVQLLEPIPMPPRVR